MSGLANVVDLDAVLDELETEENENNKGITNGLNGNGDAPKVREDSQTLPEALNGFAGAVEMNQGLPDALNDLSNALAVHGDLPDTPEAVRGLTEELDDLPGASEDTVEILPDALNDLSTTPDASNDLPEALQSSLVLQDSPSADMHLVDALDTTSDEFHSLPSPDCSAEEPSTLPLQDAAAEDENDGNDTDRSSSPTFTSIYDEAATVAGADGGEAGSSTTDAGATGGARPKFCGLARPGPTESPPPYSEVDPLPRERPEQLDLEEESAEGDNEEDPGSPGRTPNHENPQQSLIELFQGLTEEQLLLGKLSPHWIPDDDAPNCMICDVKFTFVKRRHHCRACGKVLCNPCCNDKALLKCLGDKLGRVCKPCKSVLQRLARAEQLGCTDPLAVLAALPQQQPVPPPRQPNPRNPSEYCSTVPTLEQERASGGGPSAPPSVMVPVGVLKRRASTNGAQEGEGGAAAAGSESSNNKQVMFSDGIKPGGDLAELDGSSEQAARSSSSSSSHRRHRRSKKSSSKSTSDVGKSLLSADVNQLPLIAGGGLQSKEDIGTAFEAARAEPLAFIVNKNLTVYVKLVNYAPAGKHVWNFRSSGLCSVGQDEIVLLLLRGMSSPGELERTPPREIFDHYQALYEHAKAGRPVIEMSHFPLEIGTSFLGGTDYGGFLYIRRSFQSTDDLDLPEPNTPHLFALLITKWEVPWARLFPLRLKLRLGGEQRYYPCPLWSVRDRPTVYREIGNTIMKLLIDFRNYSYSLPIIRGMIILMEPKVTTVMLPKDRYRDISRALLNSNDPVLALGACFATTGDSHLVAVQSEEAATTSSSDYETQAINIANKQRKLTGASFVVFNGALKSSSGLTAKSSLVEDGIMVQVSQDRMTLLRKSLSKMEDIVIECGPVGGAEPDEVVKVEWIEGDITCNAGVQSHIDGIPFDGVASIRLHTSRDYVCDRSPHFIRWTEVFLLNPTGGDSEPPDPMHAATVLSKAVCGALAPQLAGVVNENISVIAVRVNLDPEKISYEAGSSGTALPPSYMNLLDDVLVPLIHGGGLGSRLCIELVFRVLDL